MPRLMSWMSNIHIYNNVKEIHQSALLITNDNCSVPQNWVIVTLQRALLYLFSLSIFKIKMYLIKIGCIL